MNKEYTCIGEPMRMPEEDRDRKIRYLERDLEGCNDHIHELIQTKTVLVRLLSEEVESHRISKQLVRDVSEERDNYRRRLSDIKHFINELKPGQRITEKIIEQINRF